MNDEQLKKILQEEIFKTPSSNFNHRVLSAFLSKEKKLKSHFIPFDEPLLITMVITGLFLLSASLFYRNHQHADSNSVNANIYIVVLLLCSFIPIFIIAMNAVTKKLTQQKKANN